jgi:hypothetical protein
MRHPGSFGPKAVFYAAINIAAEMGSCGTARKPQDGHREFWLGL